eukprot:scpid43779/ scgid19181/ 
MRVRQTNIPSDVLTPGELLLDVTPNIIVSNACRNVTRHIRERGYVLSSRLDVLFTLIVDCLLTLQSQPYYLIATAVPPSTIRSAGDIVHIDVGCGWAVLGVELHLTLCYLQWDEAMN